MLSSGWNCKYLASAVTHVLSRSTFQIGGKQSSKSTLTCSLTRSLSVLISWICSTFFLLLSLLPHKQRQTVGFGHASWRWYHKGLFRILYIFHSRSYRGKVKATGPSLIFLCFGNRKQKKLGPGYVGTCVKKWYVLSGIRILDSTPPYASDWGAFLQLSVSPDPLYESVQWNVLKWNKVKSSLRQEQSWSRKNTSLL